MDVQKVMERYMEKVEGRQVKEGKLKEAKQRKESDKISQSDWKTTKPNHVHALQP